MKKTLGILMAILLLASVSGCGTEDLKSVDKFEKKEYTGEFSFNYQLSSPSEKKNAPIVIYFHGFGETENVEKCIVPETLASSSSQDVHPCFVLAPQIEDDVYLAQIDRNRLYEAVKDIVDGMIETGEVDRRRIYLMGNSFGGLATVEFAEKYPKNVAAAMVMCPALTYSPDSIKNLELMKNVPVWFCHATNDNVIPVSVSAEAVSSLAAMKAGDVRFTEFTDEEMLEAGAVQGFHQADYAVMRDGRFAMWMFKKKSSN